LTAMGNAAAAVAKPDAAAEIAREVLAASAQ
jgi:UDP-N-acetylglucosamine:LPS N-acetylglucosamine transferase